MNKSKKLLMGLVYIYIISIAAISAKDSVAFSSSGRLRSKYISKQSTYDFADTLNDDERRQIWVDGLRKARESLYGVRMRDDTNRCWVACWNEDSDFENLAITKVKNYKLPSPGCWRYKLLNRKWWESKHKEELYVECYEIEETGKKWYIAWYYDYEVR